MPNEIALNILGFLFGEDPFLDPSHRFPSFELNEDFVGVDCFNKVEEDVSLDGVSCEVERLVDLDKGTGHKILNIS
jgi:hypothetical protein